MDKETSSKRQLEQYLHHFGEVSVDALPCVLPVSHTIDDPALAESIMTQAERNVWAWCTVEVKVTFQGLTQSDYMSRCWHNDEAEFRASDTYRDMLDECISKLADRLLNIFTTVSKVID